MVSWLRKDFLSVLLSLIYLSVFLCNAEAGQDSEGAMGHGGAQEVVVAKVNGVVINMEQLMNKMREVTQRKYGRREISPLLADKIRTEATNDLITEELAFQKASVKVVVTPPMVDTHISGMKKRYGGMDGLQKYLQEEGMSYEQLAVQARRFLTVKLYVEQEIDAKIKISDQEIMAAYQGAKTKYFMQREMVQVNKMIFFLDPVAADTIEKIDAVLKRIEEETDNDPIQLTPDGSFIVQSAIKLNKENDSKLYEVAKKLPEYGFSKPIDVDGTLYVVQLTGYKPEVVKTVEEVMPYLKRKITQTRRQEMLAAWMAGLREGAEVEIVDLRM